MKNSTTAIVLAGWLPALAAADKSQYWLGNPTPRAEMREMSTDRPDQTESPHTVDAGHIQIESNIFSYSRTLDNDPAQEIYSWGETNLKLGLTHRTDLQLVFSPCIRQRENPGPDFDGVGDLEMRLKWNLFGNDDGGPALALLPYVKIPTASDGLGNDEWEGGLFVPFATALNEDWGFGAMLIAEVVAHDDGSHHFEPGLSATVSRGIVTGVDFYVEALTRCSWDGDRNWQVSLDGGLVFAITPNFQLDAGINWNFAGNEEINPFVGFSLRH